VSRSEIWKMFLVKRRVWTEPWRMHDASPAKSASKVDRMQVDKIQKAAIRREKKEKLLSR